MVGLLRTLTAVAVTACILAGFAMTAGAADLCLAGKAGFSMGDIDGSGTNPLIGPALTGSDDDATPVYGGALGVAVPLSDVFPWSLRIRSFHT